MDRNTVSSYRKRLLRQGRALLRSGVGLAGDPLANLGDHQRRELAAIHTALERIERGQYGRCEGCARPVDGGRLEARPWEPHCAACADLGMPSALAV